MNLISARHQWAEDAGFKLNRPNGTNDYVFLHFLSPVTLVVNGKKHNPTIGAVIIIPPKCPHDIFSETTLNHNWAHFSGNIKELLESFNLSPTKIYYPNDIAKITNIFEALEKEFLSSLSFKNEFCLLKINELFVYMNRSLEDEEESSIISQHMSDSLKKLRIAVFSHLDYPWKINELANSVHLSSSHFYAVYKKLFGISPNKDIILARIDKAKQLLSHSSMNNYEVAEKTGYRNEYHFIRQFKKHVGLSPGEYRKSMF